MIRSSSALLFVSGLLLLSATPPAAAQSTHQPLQTSATLGFNDMLRAALEHAPEALETDVRQQQADDYSAAGASWIAGRPALTLNYYNDGPQDNRGQREMEYGVQVPLWRPGERQASQRHGETWQQQVTLWQRSLELVLAGRLRTALADLAEAEALLQLEQEASLTASSLLAATNTLFETGSIARLDVMQAENLLLDQRRRELRAEATLVDAEIAYETLTGLQLRPALAHDEQRSMQEEISTEHPLLRYLQNEINLADSTIRQDEISAKGNPQLTLGSRRERGDRFTPYNDSINLSVTIPFGGKSYVASRSSDARRQKVDMEVHYRNMQRALQQQLHDVEHELELAAAAMPLASEQARLGEQRRVMAQAAFAEGELTLLQTLPAVQDALAATRDLRVLVLQQQRLVTVYNQLVGVLP